MRLSLGIPKREEITGSLPKQSSNNGVSVKLLEGSDDLHIARAHQNINQSFLRTVACLLLIAPVMCLMLTLLASCFLLYLNSPTYSKTPAEWQEQILRNIEYYESRQCSHVREELKIDCMPIGPYNRETCTKRNCCWSPRSVTYDPLKVDVPWCYYPPKYGGYSSDEKVNTSTGFTVAMHRKFKSFFKKDVETVSMDFRMESPTRLHVKITDPKEKRFECPYPEVPAFNGPVPSSQQYTVRVQNGSSGFNVVRKRTGVSIFTALDMGDLVYSDQYLEISAFLPRGSSIYGLGEHQGPLKINKDNNWHIITMFNRDTPPGENKNLYGSQPFYLAVEPSGDSHGFFLLNSNAIDFIVNPHPTVTIRTIGGILDMYFFLGPSPEDVVRQYSEVVGTPIMPPYWALGYHQCKYGYNSLERTIQIWNQTRQAGIPFDTQWNDIDYMESNNDFTFDKEKYGELPAFVKKLHEVGMHYVPILDPGVSAGESPGTYPPYDEGIERGIFVKDSKGKPFVAKVWNRVSTVWPDFTNPKTVQYWTDMVRMFHDQVPFDGLWIDMNEPSNFYSGTIDGCPNSALEEPQYTPHVVGKNLSSYTICMTAQQYIGNHYDSHNLFGMAEGIVTNFALSEIIGKRPFIISRSTFAGHGKFASHWTGDVFSTWYDMRMSIPQLLNFNMFQIPMVGADICGFNGNTTQALCNRWIQLGSFYPFSRNHNTDDGIDQDPVSMGELAVKSARNALTARYRLLPYLYTLFYNAHTLGTTVARPLFFEFSNDSTTLDIDEQFLWGRWLMIVPVLRELDTQVTAYLPKGIWYDFYLEVGKKNVSSGGPFDLPAPLDTIPLLVRGGGILPLQKPALTTTEQRSKPFELWVAPDTQGRAEGQLYWDDGESLNTIEDGRYSLINFTFEKVLLRGIPAHLGYQLPVLDHITVANVGNRPDQIRVNGVLVEDFEYDQDIQILSVNCSIDLKIPFNLEWTPS